MGYLIKHTTRVLLLHCFQTRNNPAVDPLRKYAKDKQNKRSTFFHGDSSEADNPTLFTPVINIYIPGKDRLIVQNDFQ